MGSIPGSLDCAQAGRGVLLAPERTRAVSCLGRSGDGRLVVRLDVVLGWCLAYVLELKLRLRSHNFDILRPAAMMVGCGGVWLAHRKR